MEAEDVRFSPQSAHARVDPRRAVDPPDRAGSNRPPWRHEGAFCIECGCQDEAACWDQAVNQPCSWARLDRRARRGVCSCCPRGIERWDEGDTTFAVAV